MRDWVANVDNTHYLFGTVAGPHPFPMMVRDFQRVIGSEARAQVLERTGRLPDAVAACVGGGSNAIGIFHAFLDDPGSGWSASRPAATGSRPAGTRRPLVRGLAGRAARRDEYLLQDDDGQTVESYSISAGLDYPGVGPEHALLQGPRRGASTGRSPTPRRWRRSRCSAGPRDHPGDRSRARDRRALELGRELGPDAGEPRESLGPGDKDVDTAANGSA